MTSSTSSSDEVVSTAPAGGANAGNRFMNWFWDLASDEATVRAQAGTMIVKFLQHSQSQQQSAASADLEYGVKRLVRGLSSSRLSARQGFAACLCEVLGTFGPVLVPSSEILRLIDESTQVTGAMKGSEERDALFGRLFGYVALIRAGRLTSDKMIAIDVFDRLLELFDAKPWFQEAVCEGLLSAYASLSGQADANKHALDRISALLRGTGVEDMTAAQLILLIGLQTHFETRSETEIEAFRELFPYKSIASLKKIESMSKTLIASCSGFPKIHRVWYYLMSGIFGMDEERNLPSERLSELTSTQAKALTRFVNFLDAHLIISTQEKRGVAFALFLELAQRVPSSLLPSVLSQALVRCLVATRGNKKHTLYSIAGQTLDGIAKYASDAASRMAIASSLIQHGSPAFDARCSCQVVADLLSGVEASDVIEHVVSVCGIVGTALGQILRLGDAALSEAVEESEGAENAISLAISGISELAGLIKNSKLSGRSEIVCIALAVLVRLACFDNGVTAIEGKASISSKKTSKKPSKREKSDSATDESSAVLLMKQYIDAGCKGNLKLSINVRRALTALESAAFANITDHVSTTTLPRNIVEAASSRLLAAASELGAVSIDKLDLPPSTEPGAADASPADAPKHLPFSVLDYVISVFSLLASAGRKLCLHGRGLGNTQLDTEIDDEDEETEDGSSAMRLSLLIATRAVEFYRTLSGASTSGTSSHSKLRAAVRNMVGQALLHVLTTTELSLQIIEDLREVSDMLLSALVDKDDLAPETTHKGSKTNTIASAGGKKTQQHSAPDSESEEGDDDEDDGESAQVTLFEACVDLLAVPGEHSVKGVRDAIKRLWSCLASSFTIDADLVLAVVDFIAGEEGVLGADVSEKYQADADSEEPIEEEAEDASMEGEEEGGDDDDDDEDEEDITLDEDAMFDMLAEDTQDAPDGRDIDDDDDESDTLQHTEDADGALVKMLEMRKQTRKKGLLDAKRIQLLNRTRAIDILEAIISKNSASSVLVPMIAPLLQCIRRVSSSTLIGSMQEGRAFLGRLRAVFESRICKEKFHLTVGQEDTASAVDAIEFTGGLLSSADATVRQLAMSAFLTLLRASSSSEGGTVVVMAESPALQALSSILATNFDLCASKKSSRVPFKLFEEVVNRYTDFAVQSLLPRLVIACASARTPYIRSESSRLVSVLVKRSKALSKEGQAMLMQYVGPILTSLAVSLDPPTEISLDNELGVSKAAPGAVVDQKSKRLRPVLELVRDVLSTISSAGSGSQNRPVETGTGVVPSIDASAIETLRRLTAEGSGLRAESNKGPAVKRLAENIHEMLEKIPSSFIASSKKAGNGAPNKKRKTSVDETPSKDKKKPKK